MDEYEVEFDRLSRFASALVVDPQSKMSRFETSLKPYICRALASMYPTNFDDLVHRAKNLEVVWSETRESKKLEYKRKHKRVGSHSDQHHQGPTKSQVARKSQSFLNSCIDFLHHSGTSSHTTYPQYNCPKCSVCNGRHRTEDCRRVIGACYECE